MLHPTIGVVLIIIVLPRLVERAMDVAVALAVAARAVRLETA